MKKDKIIQEAYGIVGKNGLIRDVILYNDPRIKAMAILMKAKGINIIPIEIHYESI